ncbi:CTP synthetase [Lacimonas salitolerans]|uniref:CTP synthetase n=1 Tax=Lacimonas salitolerans TaxID=1323750 RepID=A0ABW4EDL2_9RHOB
MMRLASILYSLISTTLAGSFIVVSLVSGYVTLIPILIAAALGFVLAVPVSWLIARQITGTE